MTRPCSRGRRGGTARQTSRRAWPLAGQLHLGDEGGHRAAPDVGVHRGHHHHPPTRLTRRRVSLADADADAAVSTRTVCRHFGDLEPTASPQIASSPIGPASEGTSSDYTELRGERGVQALAIQSSTRTPSLIPRDSLSLGKLAKLVASGSRANVPGRCRPHLRPRHRGLAGRRDARPTAIGALRDEAGDWPLR